MPKRPSTQPIISTHAPYTEGDLNQSFHVFNFHISTHAPYTEGDNVSFSFSGSKYISTHAPYTEGDFEKVVTGNTTFQYFNSRPLYRGRLIRCRYHCRRKQFQLTPPIQRATNRTIRQSLCNVNFNSRPLYRGRHTELLLLRYHQYFNSRPLYRGRPGSRAKTPDPDISTHAPYTEGDRRHDLSNGRILYFNSRPLYRGRPL